MADNTEEVGARLSLKDRRKFSADANRAATDIKKIGQAADQANRSSRNASYGVKSLSDATSGLRTVASYGVRAVATLGAGMSALATAAGVLGIKTAAGFEQSEIAFGVLLKSETKAMAMMADLRKFAENSPFALADVNTGAQRLLAMGFAAEQILPMMNTIGNAASSGMMEAGEAVKRLTYAFGQLRSAGRVQGDELRQFEEAGINVREALAKGLGVQESALPKMIESGAISAEKAIPILTAAINDRMGEMMEKQSKSWTGMWSKMKEVGQNSAGDTARAIMDPFKGSFGQISEWADRNGKKVTRIANAWTTEFQALRASGATTGLRGMVSALDSATNSGGKLTKWFDKARGVSADVASIWRNSLQPAIAGVTGAFGPLLAPLKGVDDVLHWMAAHPDAAKAIFEGAAIAITTWKLTELIMGVRNAMLGLNAAMWANPVTLIIAGVIALTIGLGVLYQKLNAGRPWWEAAIAAINPFMFVLLTVRNHLEDIERLLQRVGGSVEGFMNKVKQVNGSILQAPFRVAGAAAGALPGMAGGGVTTRGGSVMVGERAPELLTLPRGARVDPLPDGGSSPFGRSVVIEAGAIQVSTSDPALAARMVVEAIQDRLARQ